MNKISIAFLKEKTDTECRELAGHYYRRARRAEKERDQLRAQVEALRKDAERLDWIVSEGAIVSLAGVRGEPHRYRVEWPQLGRVGIYWFTSERAAIDAAMQGDHP